MDRFPGGSASVDPANGNNCFDRAPSGRLDVGPGWVPGKPLAAGVDITVIAVTDGENAYTGRQGLGAIRRVEQENALARLGLTSNKTIRLNLPDRDVEAHESELVARLREIVYADTHLIAPWRGDYHPDHEACGRAAEAPGQSHEGSCESEQLSSVSL